MMLHIARNMEPQLTSSFELIGKILLSLYYLYERSVESLKTLSMSCSIARWCKAYESEWV